jgi:putative ABC transport system permease protein
MAPASAAPSRPSSPKFGTNTIGFWGGRTSEQAGGDKAGVRCALPSTTSTASPTAFPASCIFRPCHPRRSRAERSAHLHLERQRSPPAYQEIWKLNLEQGRFFNGAEDEQRAHVCVIGSENKTKLFSGGWALGETIRLNGEAFTVIGVMKPKMQEGDNDDSNRQIYIPFNTMSDLKDTQYLDGIWLTIAATTRWSRRACARPWPPRITSAPRTTTPWAWPT